MRTIINLLNGNIRQKLKRKLFFLRHTYHSKIMGKYTKKDFELFLRNRLNINRNDHVMIHSSFEALTYWGLNPLEIVNNLKNIITKNGILLFPTFVTRNSKKYVNKSSTFNIETTPSQSGLLSEIFRRDPDTLRSLDPIKPFSVWGNTAKSYISDHHLSRYSYDKYSPLYKLCKNNGKVIGLGAPIQNLTLVHTLENIMEKSFPVKVYNNPETFSFEVLKNNGDKVTINKKILDNPHSKNMNINKFSTHLDSNVVRTFLHNFSSYFYCDAKLFLKSGIELAKKGITVYGRF